MDRIRLCCWNVNSVRARWPHVVRLVAEHAPDIVCLQEIKVAADRFPAEDFAALGYPHQLLRAIKGYNGVAILSRLPLEDAGSRSWCGADDARHLAARLPGGVVLHNFYVPAGGDVPDPAANPRFAHKLAFLDEMITWAGRLREPVILLGDLNVAPHPEDVWSHEALLDVVSHTPAETERLLALMAAHDFVDVVRAAIPRPRKLFTWWSYRARDWAASDRGRRLDHVWTSPGLAECVRDVTVLKEARGWGRPSDHVPVLVDLDPALAAG
ncbi:MAG: exodeoxyribonuclease III [Rhodothalassiaceae bacterium]|nr:MAG: exodeoxyribonuclease III [Rhodothalassiaceae bacterium]